jgi:hypothetical protein
MGHRRLRIAARRASLASLRQSRKFHPGDHVDDLGGRPLQGAGKAVASGERSGGDAHYTWYEVIETAAVQPPGLNSMEQPNSSPASPDLWICPKCGARLVSRNLWHSCGQHTLEDLFAGAAPEVLELARASVAMLRSLGDVQVIVQKSRLVCVARVRFAGLVPRKRGFQATFALHRWLDSPRVVKRVDYGPRRDVAATAAGTRSAPPGLTPSAARSAPR